MKAYRSRRDSRRGIRAFWELSPDDKARRELYGQFIKRGDLVFDVGANFGHYSKVFLGLGAKVVAIEPQLPCVEHLQTHFRAKPKFALITQALGREPGKAEMLVSNAAGLSSLSAEHVEMTKGRFGSHINWDGRQPVTITTLDVLIKQFGTPSFIKIDVEGFELEVLNGLSIPVKLISIEFTAERIERTFQAIDYLESLNSIEGQVLFDDSMQWKLPNWQRPHALKASLQQLIKDFPLCIGDVYVRQLI